MTLVTFWFLVLTVLWTGFMVLEGFDFGVGMLHGVVGANETGRRMAINTIGPLWDGNEVWLIVAAAGTFAAFPDWYATMFSGFYLVLVVLLVALIARGISFEFRGKGESDRWRRNWDRLMSGGSLVAPLLIGLALENLLSGVPINAEHEFTGSPPLPLPPTPTPTPHPPPTSLLPLLSPFSFFVGFPFVFFSVLHGASYLAIRT